MVELDVGPEVVKKLTRRASVDQADEDILRMLLLFWNLPPQTFSLRSLARIFSNAFDLQVGVSGIEYRSTPPVVEDLLATSVWESPPTEPVRAAVLGLWAVRQEALRQLGAPGLYPAHALPSRWRKRERRASYLLREVLVKTELLSESEPLRESESIRVSRPQVVVNWEMGAECTKPTVTTMSVERSGVRGEDALSGFKTLQQECRTLLAGIASGREAERRVIKEAVHQKLWRIAERVRDAGEGSLRGVAGVAVTMPIRTLEVLSWHGVALLLDERKRLTNRLGRCGAPGCGRLNLSFTRGRPNRHCNAEHARQFEESDARRRWKQWYIKNRQGR